MRTPGLPISSYADAVEFYDFLTWHIVAGPRSLSYFIPPLLLISTLLIPPSVLSTVQLRSVILPLSFSCFLYTHVKDGGFDVILSDVFMWTFVLVGFYDPRNDFSRVHIERGLRNSDDQQKQPVETRKTLKASQSSRSNGANGHAAQLQDESWEERYPASLRDRIPWTLNLVTSLRLSNWRIGDPSHDRSQPCPSQPRNEFRGMVALGCLRSYLILDTASTLSRIDPYFQSPQLSILDTTTHPLILTLQPHHITFLIPVFRVTIIQAAVYGATSFYTFYLCTFLASLTAILVPFSDAWCPWNWPVHFGPFWTSVLTRGLSGFWGKFWHQYMRNLCTPPGKAVADAIKLPRESPMRYVLLAASAFFFSGIIHMGLVPPDPIFSDLSPWQIRLLLAGFFCAQFPGFILEFVCAKYSRLLFSKSFMESKTRKIITFLWTWVWLGLTFPILGMATRELGYWKVHSVPISLWNGLLNGKWFMWS